MQAQSRLYKNNTPISSHSVTRLTPQFSRIPSCHSTPRRDAQHKHRLTFQSTTKKTTDSSNSSIADLASGDRYVPSQDPSSASHSSRFEFEGFKPSKKLDSTNATSTVKQDEHHRLMYQALIDEPIKPKALFSFSGRKRRQHPEPFCHDTIRLVATNADENDKKRAKLIRRQQEIPQKPFKVLDAPDLRPDFYLHLLAWSKDNVLAVALGHSVYLWKSPAEVTRLISVRTDTSPTDFVTCLSWNDMEHKYLALAASNGMVYVYDTNTATCVRSLKPKRSHERPQQDMIMVLAWNASVLSAGSKYGRLYFWDVARSKKFNKGVNAYESTVCSLDWNADGIQLASGGNENLARIHDIRNLQVPRCTLCGHTAAIKALSWCPFKRDILVTGGGTADRCIKIWKSSTGELHESIETGNQVTSIEWNPCQRELISAAGYPAGELVFWQFPAMDRIARVNYHGDRILFTAMSPDRNTIVTGGGDELLAFWQVRPLHSGSALKEKTSFAARPIR